MHYFPDEITPRTTKILLQHSTKINHFDDKKLASVFIAGMLFNLFRSYSSKNFIITGPNPTTRAENTTEHFTDTRAGWSRQKTTLHCQHNEHISYLA